MSHSKVCRFKAAGTRVLDGLKRASFLILFSGTVPTYLINLIIRAEWYNPQ